uniref:Uncharacterized protein n=1 Tax=Amphimedon queenslandica TaxID=400682 RepID=A0A1X7SMB4_AMPQE
MLIILGISLIMAIIVAIAGCVCLKPDEMLRKVFPYIKKSGSQIVIFDCLIDRFSVKFLYFYLTHVVTITLADILFNALVTTSSMYNPYDGLDCLGLLYNGTIIELTSEEQAEMDEVISILCVGWNLNFAVAIGHTVAVLTLSWILVSIVLWIKINLCTVAATMGAIMFFFPK